MTGRFFKHIPTYKLLNFICFDRAFYTVARIWDTFFSECARLRHFSSCKISALIKRFPRQFFSFHELIMTYLRILFSFASLKALLSALWRFFSKSLRSVARQIWTTVHRTKNESVYTSVTHRSQPIQELVSTLRVSTSEIGSLYLCCR